MTTNRAIHVYDLGVAAYRDVHLLQQRLQAQRRNGGGVDTLLLVEHHPVLTLGRSHPEPNLRVPQEFVRSNGIDIVQTERGGDITYHGPGQMVAYGIIDLRAWGVGAVDYVSGLEASAIAVLGDWGIHGERDEHGRGVWANGAKIASVGINIRGGVSMHGIALNVAPDMSHFALINPCGLPDIRMTSMVAEAAGGAVPLSAVSESFVRHFAEQFGCTFEQVELPSARAVGR